MGSIAVAVFRNFGFAGMQLLYEIRSHLRALLQSLFFRHDGFLQVCNYYLRFESTYGLYCSRCFLDMSRLCTYAITILDSNPLMGSTAVAVFMGRLGTYAVTV
ncbi:hypothetical protein CEXT_447901 [Caerostris extrusa]|uniref:Uncharacterized protein n=1 Tax=Caerostris extrusa TaxID=172846 RepID=A0AAV4RS26_CAEEX|nr:hypothetical protein CEXT_447901 [Caerostris extrusa]